MKRFLAKKFQENFFIINMNAIVEKIVVEFRTHTFKNMIIFITIKIFVGSPRFRAFNVDATSVLID